jgi:hypothetical protein
MTRRILAGTLILMATSALAGCAGIGKAQPTKTGNVTMPNMVGKNAAVAKDDLERLGFADDRIKLSPQRHIFVAMPSHWVVTDQSEKPGGQVSLRELIVLTVAK